MVRRKSTMAISSRYLLFGLIMTAALGCGDTDKGEVTAEQLAEMAGGSLKEVVPVSGKVLVDGTPTANVNLYLYSADGVNRLRQCRTGADGSYSWSTYVNGDGLEPGEYRITFRHILEERENDNSEATDDLFKSRYSKPKDSKFSLKVEAKTPQKDLNYELTMK